MVDGGKVTNALFVLRGNGFLGGNLESQPRGIGQKSNQLFARGALEDLQELGLADVAKLALLVDVDQLPVLAHGEVVVTRGREEEKRRVAQV